MFTNRRGLRPISRVAAVISLCMGAAGATYSAGFTHVDQAIFGMDCAPCAFGIEQGLKKLPGVQEVSVSLNEGKAIVTLGADSRTTLESIRTVVRENGFTPKTARVTVEGKLVKATDAVWLESPGLPRYRLIGDMINSAQNSSEGVVRVQGEVPESEGIASELTVRSIE